MEQLGKVNLIASKTWGLDKTYRIIYYGISLLASALRNKSSGGNSSNNKNEAFEVVAEKVEKLIKKMLDYRTMTRFTGFPAFFHLLFSSSLPSFRSALAHPDHDHDQLIPSFLNLLKTVSMLCYYPLEHYAWLNDEGISLTVSKKSKKVNTGPYWLAALACWAIYIMLDCCLQILKMNQLQQRETELVSRNNNNNDVEEDEERNAIREEKKDVCVSLLVNMCDYLMVLQWCGYNVLSATQLNLLGFVGGLLGYRSYWKSVS